MEEEEEQMEEMENGQVKSRGRAHSFAPLQASICLQSCERELMDVLQQTILKYFSSSHHAEQHLPISNMDVISFFTFLFTVRCTGAFPVRFLDQ